MERAVGCGMIKTTVDLPRETLAALSAIAAREGRSRSSVMRDALDEYIGSRGRPLPEWIGSIDDDDGSLMSTNVDDWLRAHRQRLT